MKLLLVCSLACLALAYAQPNHDDKSHEVEYRHGVAYNKQYVYHGVYPGHCGKDGFYFRDSRSFVICSNNNAYVQPCAPGSRNSAHDAYNYGGNYYYRDFCDVNLVDHGYAAKHYHQGYPALSKNQHQDYPALSKDQHKDYPALSKDQRQDYPALSKDQREDYPAQSQDQREDYPSLSQDQHKDYPALSKDQRQDYPALSQDNDQSYPALSKENDQGYPALSKDHYGHNDGYYVGDYKGSYHGNDGYYGYDKSFYGRPYIYGRPYGYPKAGPY